MRCSIYIVVLFLAVARGNEEEELRRIDSVHDEEECMRYGGVCVFSEDCPAGMLAEEPGLCPLQRGRGVECCHGVSKKEIRCLKRGGMCVSADEFCNPDLIFRGAKSCPDDQKCCILVI